MSRLICLAPLVVLSACSTSDSSAWAADTWWLMPGAQGDTGLISWSIFEGRWERKQSPRQHRCAALFSVELTPIDPCPGCGQAWSVSSELTDTDCAELPPSLPQLQAIALGSLPTDLEGSEPYPTVQAGTWARYDDGDWEPHGWGFQGHPIAPRPTTPPWDGQAAVTGWPAWAWPLP